jgi:hypothetical protein
MTAKIRFPFYLSLKRIYLPHLRDFILSLVTSVSLKTSAPISENLRTNKVCPQITRIFAD